jgi:hypothetical protein
MARERKWIDLNRLARLIDCPRTVLEAYVKNPKNNIEYLDVSDDNGKRHITMSREVAEQIIEHDARTPLYPPRRNKLNRRLRGLS